MVKDKIDYAKLLEMAPYLDESVYLYSETRPFKFVIPRYQLRSVVERFGQQLRV